MSTCAIRYRFDGPGPASFLVEDGGALRVYCRGTLSAPLTEGQVRVMLGDAKRRWVAATGAVVIEGGVDGWPEIAGPLVLDVGDVVVETA